MFVIQKVEKGELYFYWGWNRSWYNNSDIHFKGKDYNFTLSDVKAKDRQTPFSIDKYLNPGNATIPQYNFRIGYYFKDNYSLSIGIDHMKYVVVQNQQVLIDGTISNTSSSYDGSYTNESIILAEDFLKFEHTDGLNYLNVDIRKDFNLINKNKSIAIDGLAGVGLGILIPRTNTTLLNNERYDEFHLSGYGLNGLTGLKTTFFNWFFIQSELKGGYINMPNIRTTRFTADSASQNFLFAQANIVFGVQFSLSNK
ncbi:hypothetical protein [Psychroserpens luteus]|uniref:Outer membrane protein beta-barrel domain-containing protein n=1 Tax=Psychroserpens luteus TaxID=1434066 RepID=A0ABW5ZXV7_9FLAO|nr:hypothetical protein [Psychroserpens luteus]